MGHTIHLEHIDVKDDRLRNGRHVEHDSRSFPFAVKTPRKVADTTIFHTDRAPILNQAEVGGCVGFTGADTLNTAFFDTVRNAALGSATKFYGNNDGLQFYHDATVSDNIRGTYPPDDTGSSGLGLAKALQKLKLIKSYEHAFTWEQYLAALATQPVCLGTLWTKSMFKPDKNGVVKVGALNDANIAGGHEYMVRGRNANTGLNLARNHWDVTWDTIADRGPDAKVAGEFWITDADLKKLLANQGDITVLKI